MTRMNPMLLICLFVLIMSVCSVSMGAVYKVGDSIGWTNNGSSVDYKSWSSTKKFQVGDTIVFEYKQQFDNVVRVTHKNFNSCNLTGAYYNLSSGMDSVLIKKTGHFYFVSGFAGHCLSGQKVDIRVPGTAVIHEPPSPAPAPSQHKKSDAVSVSLSRFMGLLLAIVASVFVC